MIPVLPQKEPADFEDRVRRQGLEAIAELVGEPRPTPRPGPKRKQLAASRDRIPADAFPPYWRAALPQLLEAYGRICAYLALYLEKGTGRPTVDHFTPKSRAWELVYEWSNYRLAAGQINSNKDEVELPLDPFDLPPDLFALELFELQVVPGNGAHGELLMKVDETIRLLGLNQPEFCAARLEYLEAYEAPPGHGQIDFAYLERRAPFLARELRRQGRLRPGDL